MSKCLTGCSRIKISKVLDIKFLKSLQKAEVEPKQASTIELFCGYSERLTIFTIKDPS